MDQVAKLREMVLQLKRFVSREMPRFRKGEISTVTVGPPYVCSVKIGGSATATPNVPVLAHVTGLAAGSIVSIRFVGSDPVVDGKYT